jgi:hypothetical protein
MTQLSIRSEMSIFTHVPDEFEFEYQGGNFFAKKSFWQNTLDKSCTTYIISLEDRGEIGELDINVNTDDWEADSKEFIDTKVADLTMDKFIQTGDEDVNKSLAEAVTSPPEEETDFVVEEDEDVLPFPAVEEDDSIPAVGEVHGESFDGDNAEAVQEVDESQTNDQPRDEEFVFGINTDTPDNARYGFSQSN